jgi:hypothetical protein
MFDLQHIIILNRQTILKKWQLFRNFAANNKILPYHVQNFATRITTGACRN